MTLRCQGQRKRQTGAGRLTEAEPHIIGTLEIATHDPSLNWLDKMDFVPIISLNQSVCRFEQKDTLSF